MPSNRRLKVFLVTLAAVVITILYLSNGGSESNRNFYERTVAAMDAKKHTPIEKPGEHVLPKVEKSQDPVGIKVPPVPGKQPPQVAIGEGEDQSRRVKGSEKWDTGAEKKADKEAAEKKKKKADQTEEEKEVDSTLNQILKRSPIIIFSKSYCPFSKKAKWIFAKYDIVPAPFIVELDSHALGSQLQNALEKITGRRTVPNVLVSGASIGGGDDVAALHEQGKLEAKIKELAGKRVVQVKLKDDKEGGGSSSGSSGGKDKEKEKEKEKERAFKGGRRRVR